MGNELMTMISNVGFPIAISVALFYQLIKTNELVREFQATIVRNTATIGSLVDKIEEYGRKGG
jgi:nitrogen fixation/metabolism regulation signal transduction histidine kinase